MYDVFLDGLQSLSPPVLRLGKAPSQSGEITLGAQQGLIEALVLRLSHHYCLFERLEASQLELNPLNHPRVAFSLRLPSAQRFRSARLPLLIPFRDHQNDLVTGVLKGLLDLGDPCHLPLQASKPVLQRNDPLSLIDQRYLLPINRIAQLRDQRLVSAQLLVKPVYLGATLRNWGHQTTSVGDIASESCPAYGFGSPHLTLRIHSTESSR